ncbi:serine/threonine kinase [Tolypothrix tenuis PCC 7101]|uniref:non-specific serine/threonine protein kinase n=1 Tax=Tolypothrix tenuis PCC 7101 TaxID=231146 RepID=A0A1Z4N6M3_9CYAN|nr:serine/threonine protein kinase [Aulosira sp. FACHB-113]BAZ01380.1 serine/threonine kinase [Tolypothrix tenuis PCC 7101]BAZ74697.1 serine/threonine kinase [Aulosira laxa NIES-50]
MQTLLNNRYQVIQTLGGGGFGETFLAEDTQMPSKRRCVIKLLKPIQNNPQIYQLVRERFQREAAILEDLGGATDQIPSLYAYFQSEGQFYVVQELIEGQTLTAKFQQQGLLSESSVKEILVNLLPVLEYIHSKRIIHRDIKPDNIILRARDNKPVLIDFGAVRETMGTVLNSQGNPTSSIVIGTPGYMPSEQAMGRPVFSSDLYSLGMTAIYLLTGKQPQELETDPRTGEIIWSHHTLSVSPTFAGVIDKAIAYHPRDRFATAREMLQALQIGANTFPPTVPYVPPTVANTPAPTQYTIPVSPGASHQPNTIPVNSPPSYQPGNPSNPSNGQRGVFIASLIAGGLIGAAIIIAFALHNNKQPQIAGESTPAATESNIIRNQPQETATPTTSDRPSPEAAIQNYYANINQGQFQTSWNLLTPSLQNNRKLHPNGYLSYIDWWGGRVQSVDVTQVSLVQANAETATVDASLRYYLKNGKVTPASVRFSLLWDAQNSRWVVSDAQ